MRYTLPPFRTRPLGRRWALTTLVIATVVAASEIGGIGSVLLPPQSRPAADVVPLVFAICRPGDASNPAQRKLAERRLVRRREALLAAVEAAEQAP